MHVNLQSSVSSEGDRRRLVIPSSVSLPHFRGNEHPSRTIALAWLSDRVADQFISETLAERIHQETGRSVALLNLKQHGFTFESRNGATTPVNGNGSTETTLHSGWGWVNEEIGLAGFLPGMDGPVGRFRVQLTAEEAEAGADLVDEVEVADTQAARRLGFVGSPTIRIDGRDVSPPVSPAPAALACRTYEVDGRFSGTPSDDAVRGR